MSNHVEQFIEHLNRLRQRDRGALATLRRSLSFAPGAYPPAYAYVERFVGTDRKANDSFRLALYLVAGLYAMHPEVGADSLATGLAKLMLQRESASIESRFLALLGADPENLSDYLRHVVTLFAADNQGIDYAELFADLAVWLNPYATEKRDQVRQKWARDFYGTLARDEAKSKIAVNAAAN
jgi:CRISPR system Cascade subunit CasB